MYDYKIKRSKCLSDLAEFQFKHCTIIRKFLRTLNQAISYISIQALYDYKIAIDCGYALAVQFQFKHCTIISISVTYYFRKPIFISIQALYDYKSEGATIVYEQTGISIQALYDYKDVLIGGSPCFAAFQFKHCTIISSFLTFNSGNVSRFQFKHCTIIRALRVSEMTVYNNFNSSIVRL